MGESKLVTKEEIHDLAREFGGKLGEAAAQVRDQDARIQSLAIAFDALVTVLDEHFCPSAGGAEERYQQPISKAVKTELAKRKAAIEAKANADHDTSGEPYDPSAPVNIAAHAKARRERTGRYAPGACDDPDKK